ncbi:MAG: hypothetical protein AB1420_02255 [Bacillota bacterium]
MSYTLAKLIIILAVYFAAYLGGYRLRPIVPSGIRFRAGIIFGIMAYSLWFLVAYLNPMLMNYLTVGAGLIIGLALGLAGSPFEKPHEKNRDYHSKR